MSKVENYKAKLELLIKWKNHLEETGWSHVLMQLTKRLLIDIGSNVDKELEKHHIQDAITKLLNHYYEFSKRNKCPKELVEQLELAITNDLSTLTNIRWFSKQTPPPRSGYYLTINIHEESLYLKPNVQTQHFELENHKKSACGWQFPDTFTHYADYNLPK